MNKKEILKDIERQLDFLIDSIGNIDIKKIALQTVFTKGNTPYECIHCMECPEISTIYPLNDENESWDMPEKTYDFRGTGYDNEGDDDLPPGHQG